MRKTHPVNLHTKPIYYTPTHKTSSKFSTCHEKIPSLSILKLRNTRSELANLLHFPFKPIVYYKKIHTQILVWGFQCDVFLANILLNCYSKSNSVDHARSLFDTMPHKNLVTWSSIVSMYSQHGYSEEALRMFSEFQRSLDKKPNEFVLASVLRACTQSSLSEQGMQVHCFVTKTGFNKDVFVGTSLVDFYSKVGDIEQARLAFDSLSKKTTVTWTTIITGYVKCGRSEVSLDLFKQMRETGVIPDRYVFSSILSACSMLEFLKDGKTIHGHMLRMEKDPDVSVVNTLIDLYTKCDKVRTARILFDKMEFRNVISWTTMISGYMKNSFDLEALKLFVEMTRAGLRPDGFACTSVLTSCGSVEALEKGKQVHCYAVKSNLESDEFVKNGLIDMYAKCGSLDEAKRSFDLAINRTVVSYNAMIEGYTGNEKLHEALDLFHEMRYHSYPPEILTFVSFLGVSASLFSLKLSQQIHGLILKYGFLLGLFASSSLIDVYSKCSRIEDARLVFDEVKKRNIVVWNAMLFGYAQHSINEEALKLFVNLKRSRLVPNEYTYVASVTASSNLASLPHGEQFHGQLVVSGLDFVPFITNALVDMYAKCGNLQESNKIFTHAPYRDVVCWNTMLSMYAHHGKFDEALGTFEKMKSEEIVPNYVTFVGLLSACSHAGLVGFGLRSFESMRDFGVEPGLEHYACVVSLLGRAGKLYEARDFIEKIPIPIRVGAMIWRSLLSVCRECGNVEVGEYAAEKAILMEPWDSGSYILLSNIYASKGMWVDVKRMRERMVCNRAVKEPGQSWIELNKRAHTFVVRDGEHCERDVIYSVLDCLIQHSRVMGYVPDVDNAFDE